LDLQQRQGCVSRKQMPATSRSSGCSSRRAGFEFPPTPIGALLTGADSRRMELIWRGQVGIRGQNPSSNRDGERFAYEDGTDPFEKPAFGLR
jgi:hypothetical protein